MPSVQDQVAFQESGPIEPTVTRGMRTLYIDGEPYEFRSEGKCVICQSPERVIIERGLILQHSYRTIAKALPPGSGLWTDTKGNPRTVDKLMRRVQQHSLNGHSNLDAAVARRIMERYAEKAGIDLFSEDDAGSILTDVGLLDEVKRLAYEDMVTSGRAPSLNQMLRAIELSLSFQDVAGDSNAQVFVDGFRAIMETLTETVGPDTLSIVVGRLQHNEAVMGAWNEANRALEAGDDES